MITNDRPHTGWGRRAAVLVTTVSLAISALALIQAGGATTLASALSGHETDPITYLGLRVELKDCVKAPLAIGDGSVVLCNRWNGVVAPDGVVDVVTLHALDTSSIVQAWRGDLPKGLHWSDSIADVRGKLGEPSRITSIYGTPTFVYMFRGERFGSLELRFSAGDRLESINACLTR
jgi:hypothetical protein